MRRSLTYPFQVKSKKASGILIQVNNFSAPFISTFVSHWRTL